jgi:hypothetical protein
VEYNQWITIGRRSDLSNDTGGYTYSQQISLVRLELKQESFKTQDGVDLISFGIMYIRSGIKNGDRVYIDKVPYTVQNTYDVVDVNGQKQHTKCWLV